MSSAPHQPPPRPTLEELLRFKRAERPSPEFWAEFDRGLRQKQLAALMQRPQGWSRVRPVLFRGLRWAVPATAAAAVVLVVLQTSGLPRAPQAPVVALISPHFVPVSDYPAPPSGEASTVSVQESQPEHAVQVREELASVARAETSESLSTTAAVEQPVSWPATLLASNDLSGYRRIVMNTVHSPAREPRRSNSSWTSRFNEMVREMSEQQSEARVMQLASMNLSVASPFSSFSYASAPVQTVASSDRSSRGLSDREFRDLDSRFGVKGTSLSIKF